MLKPFGHPETVGELRKLLEGLPDDMPLHQRGNLGEFLRGIWLFRRKLAEAKGEAGYYADIEHDQVWSKPEKRGTFGKTFDALCIGL